MRSSKLSAAGGGGGGCCGCVVRIAAAIPSAVCRARSRASGSSSHSMRTWVGLARSTVAGSVMPGTGQRERWTSVCCCPPPRAGTPSAWTTSWRWQLW